MDPKYYGIVEMVFTGGVVLGLAVWQLWSISREVARDRAAAAERLLSPRAGHAVGEHLPDDG